MNLYLFNHNDSAATYGIGTYLKELTDALDKADIHIHIVHLHAARRKFEITKTNGIENWYIPEASYNNSSIGAIQEIEDYYHNVVYLLRLHIKDTKDLVFHFNYNQCFGLARKLKSAFNCKTLAVIHYTKWQLEMHGNLSRLLILKGKTESERTSSEQIMYRTYEYERALFKEVDSVITLSQYMRHLLESEYQLNPNKISVIPNGLNDTNGTLLCNRIELRKKWHIAKDELIILFVGRLDSVKGLIFLIRAFRQVLDKFPDCRLIIAGSGNYDIYLQEATDICTRITFTGFLKKKELYELYQIADMGVMPSFHEQCSYVAMEMMMYGLPLIASTSTGLNEMIIEGETGLHIPVIEHPERMEIDSSLLAEKILYLLQYPEERKQMGLNAYERYKAFYSSEIFRKNMVDFYNYLTNQ